MTVGYFPDEHGPHFYCCRFYKAGCKPKGQSGKCKLSLATIHKVLKLTTSHGQASEKNLVTSAMNDLCLAKESRWIGFVITEVRAAAAIGPDDGFEKIEGMWLHHKNVLVVDPVS